MCLAKCIFFLTFFNQGSKYWEFENRDPVLTDGVLSDRFPGLPSGIDAIFIWTGNGKTYAIKGKYHTPIIKVVSPFFKRDNF